MNAGAAVATAKWLLFLHVDTVLPADDIPHLLAPAADDRLWGRFDVQIGADGVLYRVIGWSMNLRSRLTGIATGDQAIFVRRDAFRSAGGFQPIPLMEDIELSRRLRRRCGRPLCLRSKVTTSARRWQACGVLRTIWRMWMLRLRFTLGASPDRLARCYREVSGR
jgi:rSAM/selenodomain-associated transferase 2